MQNISNKINVERITPQTKHAFFGYYDVSPESKYGKKILYHSCGSVISQIDNLSNLPIDILNPLQPLAAGMDFQKIKDTWGNKLCFHGAIDIQKTLPQGTAEEVQAAVKRAISILGNQGGYIMTSAHYIQNDTPVENIIAMYDTAIR